MATRKIFICLHKSQDDYRTLPDGETIFIYKMFPSRDIKLDEIWLKCIKVLADADPVNDLIVFNGPSVLVSIAGSVWFADEQRQQMGVLAFDTYQNKYIEHQEQIP